MKWKSLPSYPAGGQRCPALACSAPVAGALENKWPFPVCPGHWQPYPDRPSSGGTAAPACLRSHTITHNMTIWHSAPFFLESEGCVPIYYNVIFLVLAVIVVMITLCFTKWLLRSGNSCTTNSGRTRNTSSQRLKSESQPGEPVSEHTQNVDNIPSLTRKRECVLH